MSGHDRDPLKTVYQLMEKKERRNVDNVFIRKIERRLIAPGGDCGDCGDYGQETTEWEVASSVAML